MPRKTKVLDLTIGKIRIAEAARGDKKHCAIANAIQESDDNIAGASADVHYIKIFYLDPAIVERYRTPKPARDFIIDFDNNRMPAPFRLQVFDTDWVSTQPRRMNQRQQRETVAQRKSLARATGRKLIDVTEEEAAQAQAEVFADNGFATTKTGAERVVRRHRPSKATRQYAKRQTASAVFAEFEAQKQMAAE